jgi:hypothetical protein
MAFRLLADENFHADIVRGLRLRLAELDLVRVQDVQLRSADDPTILEWAAANDRILLTHDRATMPGFAYDRVTKQAPMPGVFVINDHVAIRDAIDELQIIIECTQPHEWNSLVAFIPL